MAGVGVRYGQRGRVRGFSEGSWAAVSLSEKQARPAPPAPGIAPTSGPLPLAAAGLWACPRGSRLTSVSVPASLSSPLRSRPLPLGSPRGAVPCPPPLIFHFKAACRGAALLPAVLQLRMVTPETLLRPFPRHPASLQPRWQRGSPGLRASVPASPPCRLLRSPRGSGEPGDGESDLIKSSSQVIGCDLCPPQLRARGSCFNPSLPAQRSRRNESP